jgi:hypothetical protein
MSELHAEPEPEAPRVGTVIAFPGRDGEPFFLYGFTGPRDVGSVGITNSPDMAALGASLWRFRTREQAEAASLVVERYTRLDHGREVRFVPEAREARTPVLAVRAFYAWARRVTPAIERALAEAKLGAGAYPLVLDSIGSRLQ